MEMRVVVLENWTQGSRRYTVVQFIPVYLGRILFDLTPKGGGRLSTYPCRTRATTAVRE